MPELPELQAHAERLSDAFGGRTLAGFRPMTFTALKTVLPGPDELVGRPLDRVERTGKYLMLRFGDDRFVVHLMQGGRLGPDAKQSAKPRGGLARWTFDDGSALLLTEMAKEKRAGVWVVAGDPTDQSPLEGLGPDALGIGRDALADALAGHKSMRVHGFLRDQRAIAGIGRRLSSEICWRAKLSPFASTHKLTDDEIDRLHAALASCIDDALAFERAAGRHELVGRAARRGLPARRRGVPRLRRDHQSRRVQRLHGQLLPHLPDRRQGPGRQHHLEVPEVDPTPHPERERGAVRSLPRRHSASIGPDDGAQMRPRPLTASRSSTSSATEASMRAREKSSMSRPWTMEYSPPEQVTGNDDMRPSGTP